MQKRTRKNNFISSELSREFCGILWMLTLVGFIGKTAIMEACAAGRDDLVQLLIDHGSCVADTDNNNWNSLTHAAANGRVHCANVVLRHLKYDQESQEKLKEVVKKDDKKPTKTTTAKIAEKAALTAATASATSKTQAVDSLDDYDDTECPAESALAIAAQKGTKGSKDFANLMT